MKKDGDYVKLFDVGETLYRIGKAGITKITIVRIEQYPHYVYYDDHNRSYFNHSMVKSCFRTYEEAVQATIRRDNIAEKRKMLKEYEKELNKKFNIEDHYIVK